MWTKACSTSGASSTQAFFARQQKRRKLPGVRTTWRHTAFSVAALPTDDQMIVFPEEYLTS
jgi:hypothetical protein